MGLNGKTCCPHRPMTGATWISQAWQGRTLLCRSQVAFLVVRLNPRSARRRGYKHLDLPPFAVTSDDARPVPQKVLIAHLAADGGGDVRDFVEVSRGNSSATGDIGDLSQPALSHQFFE